MTHGYLARLGMACGLAVALSLAQYPGAAAGRPLGPASLDIDSARVTLAGTSNIHAYTAATTAVRVSRVQLAAPSAGVASWDDVLKPGAVTAFEVAIPAATLSSPKGDLDKNMHKALKVQQHPDITFSLLRLEPGPSAGAVNAVGSLQIAGVAREVVLGLEPQRNGSGLLVKGELQLLMTDYGIKPPTAMLGMLKTDPKVTVTFEANLAIPLM